MRWRLIKSAPRDGSEILATDLGGNNPEVSVTRWSDDVWETYAFDDGHYCGACWLPTHWRPLPPLPEPTPTAQEGD
jgi:hypothetical protein